MGAAAISGLFAVVLACLAWIFKNGSRQARLLSRIERYAQVLKDLPEGHPARAHLDAVLAADTEQLLSLTSRRAPEAPPALQDPWRPPAPRPAATSDPTSAPSGGAAGAHGQPAGDLADEDDGIDWMGDEQERRVSPPMSPAQPPLVMPSPPPPGVGTPPPATPPMSKQALLVGHGSTVLWVLAALTAVVSVGLAVNELLH